MGCSCEISVNLITLATLGALVAATTLCLWQQHRIRSLARELERLAAETRQTTAHLTELERTRASQEQQVGALRDKAQGLDVERERAATLLGQARKEVDQLGARLSEIEARLRTSESERNRLTADLQVAQAQAAASARSETSLRLQLGTSENERKNSQDTVTRTQAQHAALQRERDSLREQLQSQRAWVVEQTQLFEKSVLAAARQLMDERGKALTEQNKREVDAVVSPFKEQLQQFRQRVDTIYARKTPSAASCVSKSCTSPISIRPSPRKPNDSRKRLPSAPRAPACGAKRSCNAS
jgi:chromosome segregation ATPase